MNGDPLAAQRRYARWLLATTRFGALLLVVTFTAYVAGWVKPYVAIERLPSLWKLPASEFLRQVGMAPGFHGWASRLMHGDMLVLGSVALLISSSIFCLAAAVPVFWRQRERLMVALCVLQIVVLVIAASGLVI